MIYIAGPYIAKTEKQILKNIENAREIAIQFAKRKIPYFCPHLNSIGFHKESELKDMKNSDWYDMDLAVLIKCSAIFMLPEWKTSTGAVKEHKFAEANNIKIYYEMDIIDSQSYKSYHKYQRPVKPALIDLTLSEQRVIDAISPQTILQEAKSLVYGERGEDYGHPKDDFKCVTEMFNIYLRRKYPMVEVRHMEPGDHAIYMIFTKIARHANHSKRDNLVDIAGYVETLAIIEGFDTKEIE